MKKKVIEFLVRVFVFIVSAASFIVMYMVGKWVVNALWQ
jgi:hypothetical protein